MKKLFLLILTLIMAFSLCACEGVERLGNIEPPALPDADSSAEPEASPTPEPQAQEAAASCRTSVYFDHFLEENFDPATGEKLILSFSYDALSVHMEGRDSAATAINEYLATVDETYYTGNDYGTGSSVGKSKLLELAEDNFKFAYDNDALDMNLEYSSSRTADIVRSDGRVLSILYTDNVYTGGDHSSYGYDAYVFDSQTGARLTLDTISDDAEGLKQFITEQMLSISEREDIAALIDAELVPADTKAQVFASLLRDGSWYFGNDGLAVLPQPGEISGTAAGIVEFVIPYTELEGKIDAKWLPSESAAEGKLGAKAFEDIEDGTMEISDKIVVDEDGRQLCIIAEGSIYDVKLSQVEYSDKFYETQRIWYCNELTDCAVQVVTMIPEGMPDLMVSYRSADGTINNMLISESGLDGSIVLVAESDIEAVG